MEDIINTTIWYQPYIEMPWKQQVKVVYWSLSMKRLHISLISIIIIMTITINPASPWPSAGQHPRLIAEMMADRAELSMVQWHHYRLPKSGWKQEQQLQQQRQRSIIMKIKVLWNETWTKISHTSVWNKTYSLSSKASRSSNNNNSNAI